MPSSIESPNERSSACHAGIWSFTPRPFEADDLRPIAASLAYRVNAEVTFGHCRGVLWSGASAWDADIALTWAGRLDYADDLKRSLRHEWRGCRPGDDVNAALFLRCYLERGLSCLEEFVGDWSIAIWDARVRQLILATDFFGTKPLYYRRTRNGIAWSSELSTFVALDGRRPTFNESYLVSWVLGVQETTSTPYQSVARVPRGHAVVLSENGERTIRGWRPDPGAETIFRRECDYDDQFRALFEDAIRVRLPRNGEPVWSELSGGLDSSSVVCVATDLWRRGEVSANLTTVSYVFSESKSADESRYSEIVETACGTPACRLDECDFPMLSYGDCSVPVEAPLSGVGRLIAVEKRMQESGARVLLSGRAGDAVMWSLTQPRLDLLDTVSACDVPATIRTARRYTQSEAAWYWSLLRHDIMPGVTRRSARKRVNEKTFGEAAPWIVWDRVGQVSNPDIDVADSGVRQSRREHMRVLDDTVRIFATNDFRHCSRLDTRYPFLDRRVVQFMLSVPGDQKRRPGIKRVLHRRALASVLPEEIATRKWKANSLECVMRAIKRERDWIDQLFEGGLELTRSGYVSEASLRKSLESVFAGYHSDFLLLRLFSLEGWLQQMGNHLGTLFHASRVNIGAVRQYDRVEMSV